MTTEPAPAASMSAMDQAFALLALDDTLEEEDLLADPILADLALMGM